MSDTDSKPTCRMCGGEVSNDMRDWADLRAQEYRTVPRYFCSDECIRAKYIG